MYSDFVKRNYKLVYETGEEAIYSKKSKLVVFVKDEDTGRKIYSIVKTLKAMNFVFGTQNMSFKIDKYIINKKEKRVQVFRVDFHNKFPYLQLSTLKQLQEKISLIDDMGKKGFVLDASKFENEKCHYISTFLSFFTPADDEIVDSSKGYLVKYIHYVFSGRENFDEYYQNIADNAICNVSDFPYSLPVIKMCYNYFKMGNIPENFHEILEEEIKARNVNEGYNYYLIADRDHIKDKYKLLEENDEYTVYDGNIKIYHNVSSEFEAFLRHNEATIEKISTKVCECLDTIIIDFNGNIIGYKFIGNVYRDFDGNISGYIYHGDGCAVLETCTILDEKFKYQTDIIHFISKMISAFLDILNTFYDYDNDDDEVISDSVKNRFSIAQSLLFCPKTYSKDFNVKDIKELFNLVMSDENYLKNQSTDIFFRLYLEYLKNQYAELSTEEQFFDKMEVKFLPPVLARELVNYALKRKVNREAATLELLDFLFRTKKTTSGKPTQIFKSKPMMLYYDSRFEYDPYKTPFCFDYEAEKKYGIKLEKGTRKILSDGRTLVMFGRSRKISNLKEKITSLTAEISRRLGNIEDSHVKIIGISEIIYSKNITDNTYNVIGYITEIGKGKRLTDEVLLGLSNKDFLKVAAYLFTKFWRYYIPWQNIWMDENFKFCINILDDNFQLRRLDYSVDTSAAFLNWLTHYMIANGYNKNAFFGLSFASNNLRQYLIDLANSFDTYCDEHDIYYNSNCGMCPVCLETRYLVSKDYEKNAEVVFEDSFAKHYSIDKQYNLKIYKATCENLSELEENVDNIICSRLNSEKSKLGQDCFVPYKKAVDKNKQFIGYIYNAVQFRQDEDGANVCKDIQSTKQFKNLHRIKSLIRLIMQINEITERGMGFIKSPFNHVFLSKSHKKQVQILNIDFLRENGNIEDTIKWTASYVKKVLKVDDSIEISLPEQDFSCFDFLFEKFKEPGVDNEQFPLLLNVLLVNLQDLAKNMTKYCSIHDMYYTGNHMFCPKCASNIKFEDTMLKRAEKAVITRIPSIAEGGEAFIYPYGNGLVAKVFKEEEIDYNFKGNILSCVFGKKDILETINNQNLKYRYIIPEKILVDEKTNQIFGYIMDRVEGMELSSLRDKNVIKELGFTMQDTLEILITVGQGIESLHANDIFIGDLNGKNILFDKQKNVYFLDFDGMGINGISPEFCTEGYIDPVSKKNRKITMKDDYYSFAVQAFYYLTFVHPFNGIYYVRENGKERNLEIEERMERRISLLGNHGVAVPAIAEPWDWMSKELKKEFLSIFEGNVRESIVSFLIRQYESMYKDSEVDAKEFRINPKFVAREIPATTLPKHKNLLDWSEYIAVKRHSDYLDTIEYKRQYIGYMRRDSLEAKYKIIYDNTTNLWLVINSDGYGVIIKSKCNFEYFEFQRKISAISLGNICFDKRKVYIPGKDCLYITKVGDQTITKKMECPGIMTPDSKLYNFNTDGFSVMTNNKFYEVRRG